MQKIRQNWKQVSRIEPSDDRLPRPISMLDRKLLPQSVVPAHRHDWGQLVYAYQGVLDVTTPSGRYLVPPHRAVWVPPGEPHEISSLSGANISSVYIAVEEAEPLRNQCYVIEVSALLRELIIEALRQPNDYDWSSPTGRLFRTIRDQIAAANSVPLHLPLPNDPRLLKICSELQNHPESKRNLDQWGAFAGASGRTLQRLFQKETGLSFQSWRQQLRLQIALQRFVTDGDSVTRIAVDLGYESSSAFIAMFQQQLGITPGEYVKSLRMISTTKTWE
jgi:AraC-like DNA-binding protein